MINKDDQLLDKNKYVNLSANIILNESELAMFKDLTINSMQSDVKIEEKAEFAAN